jgi:hypothetical protein
VEVLVNGRRGMLTGRSSLQYLEVRWEEGEDAGNLARVRGRYVQLPTLFLDDRIQA